MKALELFGAEKCEFIVVEAIVQTTMVAITLTFWQPMILSEVTCLHLHTRATFYQTWSHNEQSNCSKQAHKCAASRSTIYSRNELV